MIFTERELKGRNIRDLSTLFSMILGDPVSALVRRPLSYGFDVATGEVEPQELLGLPAGFDLGRGLITGTPSPGSR